MGNSKSKTNSTGQMLSFSRIKKNSISLLSLLYPEDLKTLSLINNKKLFKCISKEKNKLLKLEEKEIRITGRFSQIVKLSSSRILTSLANDKKVYIWKISTGKVVKAITIPFDDFQKIIKLSSKKVAYVENNYHIAVLDLTTGRRIKSLTEHKNQNIDCLIKLNRFTLASGSELYNTIKIWDLITDSCLETISYKEHVIKCFFKFNEFQLVTAGNSIRIWDINTYKCINGLNTMTTLNYKIKASVKLNDSKIAYIINNRLFIWEIQIDKCIDTKYPAYIIVELNKFHLAISGIDNNVQILDRETLDCLNTINVNIGLITK